MKETLGKDEAKEIGDRFEVTRVAQNQENVSLAERVLFLHNNRIVQNLTLNGAYSNTTSALGELRGTDLLICGSDTFYYCFELIKDLLDVQVIDSKSES